MLIAARNAMMAGKLIKLPYIKLNGYCWFATTSKVQQYDILKFIFSVDSFTNDKDTYFIGTSTSTGDAWCSYSKTSGFCQGRSPCTPVFNPTLGSIIVASTVDDSDIWTFNGTSYTSGRHIKFSSYPNSAMGLGAISASGYMPDAMLVGKIFRYQQVRNGQLIADYKPTLINNTPCLYDNVSGDVRYKKGSRTVDYGELTVRASEFMEMGGVC